MSASGDDFNYDWNISSSGDAYFHNMDATGNFDHVEYRIHPEGVPGQMESEMRRLMGDKEYERMKQDGKRYTEAYTQMAESKARFWRNMADFSRVATFGVAAAVLYMLTKDFN